MKNEGIFVPSGVQFHRVSGRLVPARYIVTLPWLVVIGGVVWLPVFPLPFVVRVTVSVAMALALLWTLWFVPRYVKFFAWALTDTELYVRHGRMFRVMNVVPLARIQYVDVSSGPVERMLGLATVCVNTAASNESVTISGLTPDDAAQLRHMLSVAARKELAGL